MPTGARFIYMEPSKVGYQHNTLNEGYLRAVAADRRLAECFDVEVHCHPSVRAAFHLEIRQAFTFIDLPVIDPEKRQFVIKCLLEIFVVCRAMLRLRANDVLYVSCIFSPSLWLIEKVRRLRPTGRIIVCLHNEVEAIWEPSIRRLSSYGYWAMRWLNDRRLDSTLELAVIDNFIKDRIVAARPANIATDSVHVFPYPVQADFEHPENANDNRPSACFIGYKMAFKGFSLFERVAAAVPHIDFVAVGNGRVEILATGEVVALTGTDAYFDAVAAADFAVFPYIAGYHASLSAAAIDAVSAGLHLVATPLGCFQSLYDELGDQSVTLCDGEAAMVHLFSDAEWVDVQRRNRQQRLERLAQSKYGAASVARSLHQMIGYAATAAGGAR